MSGLIDEGGKMEPVREEDQEIDQASETERPSGSDNCTVDASPDDAAALAAGDKSPQPEVRESCEVAVDKAGLFRGAEELKSESEGALPSPVVLIPGSVFPTFNVQTCMMYQAACSEEIKGTSVVEDSDEACSDKAKGSIDLSVGISEVDDLKFMKILNDRDNDLYEKTFICDGLTPANSVECCNKLDDEKPTSLVLNDLVNVPVEKEQALNDELENKETEVSTNHVEVVNTGSTHKTGDNNFDKIQKMIWLKSQSNPNVTMINPHSKLELKSLPKKEDKDDFEGFQKSLSRKKHNKKQSTINVEERSLVEEESSDSTCNGGDSQQSFNSDKVTEEKQLNSVLAETISSPQKEDEIHKTTQTNVKLEIYEDNAEKNDGELKKNLECVLNNNNNNQNSDEDLVHELEGDGDYSENDLPVDQETREEDLALDKLLSKIPDWPEDAASFVPWPNAENTSTNSLNKNQAVNEVKINIQELNKNCERPIHGRSGKDIDFNLQQYKNQKSESLQETHNKNELHQNDANKGLESHRVKSSYNENQNCPLRNSENLNKNQENDKQVKFTRRPIRQQDNKTTVNNNRVRDSRNAVQNNENKDQFKNNKPQDNRNPSQQNIHRQDRNQNYSRYQDNMNRNDNYNRNQNQLRNQDNCSKNQESNNNQNYCDKNKDMIFRNWDQYKNQNNFGKSNPDAKQNQNYLCKKHKEETKNEVNYLEESWDSPSNKKVNDNSFKQTKEKTQECARPKGITSSKQEPKNTLGTLQGNRRESNSSLNQKIASVGANKEIKAETISSLGQANNAMIVSQDKRYVSNGSSNQNIPFSIANKEIKTEVVSLLGQGNVNQKSTSGSKPNVVMVFDGNQNVQRALGMNSSTCSSSNASTEASVSDVSNSDTKSLYVNAQAAQNAFQSQSTVNTSYNVRGTYDNLPVNIKAQHFQHSLSNFNQNHNLNNQYSTKMETQACSGYYPMSNANLSEQEYQTLELQLLEKMLKESDIVASAKRYLASAEANLFSTQSRLDEIRARSLENSNLMPQLLNNMMMRNQSDSSLLGDPQQIQYPPPPGFCTSLQNFQKTSQTEDYVQPNATYMSSPDYPGDAFVLSYRQMAQRLSTHPSVCSQHGVYQTVSSHAHGQYPNNNNLTSASRGIPPMNVPLMKECRESKTSDNQYYNQ